MTFHEPSVTEIVSVSATKSFNAHVLKLSEVYAVIDKNSNP